VKVTLNAVVIPGDPPLCDQELKTDIINNYIVAVNDKIYETAVEISPRREVITDGKYVL
jgi:hypothetical protein